MTNNPVDGVLGRLSAHGCKFTKRGDGYESQCPAHSDRRASLSVSRGRDGRALLHCHAGCTLNEITSALGIEPGDLFASNGKKTKPKKQVKSKSHEVCTYLYTDEAGVERFTVHRFAYADGTKTFKQSTPGPNGSRAWKLGNVKTVVYRLPEVRSAIGAGQPVWVVEGEKDANTLFDLGLVGTCNPMGAGKWRAEHTACLRGAREVVIIPDADRAGKLHAREVRKGLRAAGIKARIVELPDGPKDVTEFVERGADVAAIEALAYVPLEKRIFTAAELAKTEFPPLRWAVPGLLPAGLILVVGPPKAAKSFLVFDLLGCIAEGRPVLGSVEVEPGAGLYLALEDSPRRLKGRLGMLGLAASDNLFLSCAQTQLGDGLEELVIEWLREHPDARAVCIDTLGRVKRPRDRGDDPYQAETAALARLQSIASESNVALLVIHHTRKTASNGNNEGDFLEGVLGSQALAGTADAVMVLRRPRCENKATLQLTGREIAETELALEFEPATGRWKLLGPADEVFLSPARRSVLDALRDAGRPMGTKELGDACDVPYATMRKTTSRMADKGQIVRTALGRFRLPDPPTETDPQSQTHSLSTLSLDTKDLDTCPTCPTCPSGPIGPTCPTDDRDVHGDLGQAGTGGVSHSKQPKNNSKKQVGTGGTGSTGSAQDANCPNEKPESGGTGPKGGVSQKQVDEIAARLCELGQRAGDDTQVRQTLVWAAEHLDAGELTQARLRLDNAENMLRPLPAKYTKPTTAIGPMEVV
jgi:5S rRNA maturation endonuclease (ribonuclease M5)